VSAKSDLNIQEINHSQFNALDNNARYRHKSKTFIFVVEWVYGLHEHLFQIGFHTEIQIEIILHNHKNTRGYEWHSAAESNDLQYTVKNN